MRLISDLSFCVDLEIFLDLMFIFCNFIEILINLNVFKEEGMFGFLDFFLDFLCLKKFFENDNNSVFYI